MTRDKERRLVDALAQRTKERDLDWRVAMGKDAYILSFVDSSIIIGPDPASSKRALFVEITNDEGLVVDRFDGDELGKGAGLDASQWTHKIKDIHDGARRTVLKADVILESILERLEH